MRIVKDKEPKPEKDDTTRKKTKSTKTGDMVQFYLAVIIIAGTVIVITLKIKRK